MDCEIVLYRPSTMHVGPPPGNLLSLVRIPGVLDSRALPFPVQKTTSAREETMSKIISKEWTSQWMQKLAGCPSTKNGSAAMDLSRVLPSFLVNRI
jgi:hypothetical protein